MPHLVALDLPGGQEFVDALRREWDAGHVVMPVDQRLPDPARRALFDAMQPDAVVDHTGRTRLDPVPEQQNDSLMALEDGDALLMATSGSTGSPKGAVLTHDAVRASALATSRRLGTGPDDTWLACLPLAHVGGLSVVTRALHSGSGLVVHDGFHAAAVEQAARDGVTAVSLVATALARIDPSLFRVIVLGGSRPPADRPAHSVATYGMTETGSGVVYDGVPLEGVEITFRDGEVLLRCPMLMRGYRNHPSPIDDDGWLHTGDLGHWLPDGRLQVEGRRGDMIVTGGENVWPEAVEGVLATHPAVAEVAVTGVPDPEWGAVVTAWVVASDATRPPSLDELRDHVRVTLPAFCAPRRMEVVDMLPRTALGKIQRHRLARD
ncbi:MAG: class I adenylate-forming enzyme family protein [Ilumatobacteraceae bacterium]